MKKLLCRFQVIALNAGAIAGEDFAMKENYMIESATNAEKI
ncbi:MAG: hypothetical protein WC806_02605 [Candidatus Gracilibacteria bacterium]